MAERLGNHQSVQCSEAIKAEAYEVMKLTNELYRAVSEREFVLYYQPQVDVTTETIIGVEALIRWNHPDKGLIPPGKFIPIAESTGLIVDIGLWAMQEACMQAKKWQNKKLRSLNIAVNVSLGQLLNPSFVDDVGTEYFSLSRLKAMPVDKIKIDMRFVCIFREICASVPKERSAIPLETERSSAD